MAKILLINGPNLNLLGGREQHHYGQETLATIVERLNKKAAALGHNLTAIQSNAEHELIDWVQRSQGYGMLLLNPAAFTHTSIAIRDALQAVEARFIELHLSNIYAREDFRQVSYFSDIAVGSISGFGPYVYDLALTAADHYLTI